MISPKATHLLIKYFDSIDKLFSKYMNRKRPWDEEALTTVLCDLLEDEYQLEENISYSKKDLYNDFSKFDEPIAIYTRIETHKYTKYVENRITHADIGIIINYQNQFEKNESFKRCWLLQSKRLFHSKKSNFSYTTESRFESFDNEQHKNILKLNKKYGCEFVKYLLYCPRFKNLERQVREELVYAQNKALRDEIFDYTFGLELRDDLMNENNTISSSLYVCSADSFPDNFLNVYELLFGGITPFAWFIIQHFNSSSSKKSWDIDYNENYKNVILERIVRGDTKVLQSANLSEEEVNNIIPLYTIEINIIHGLNRQ